MVISFTSQGVDRDSAKKKAAFGEESQDIDYVLISLFLVSISNKRLCRKRENRTILSLLLIRLLMNHCLDWDSCEDGMDMVGGGGFEPPTSTV